MWIRVDASLADHKKTRHVANTLTRCCTKCGHAEPLGTPQAIGHLVLLWLKCLDQAVDGDLTGNSDPADLAFFARWEGDPAEFADVLQQVGFLEPGDDGLHIHDWMEYAGSLKAALQKRRQRTGSKKRKTQRKPPCPKTVPGQSLDSPKTVLDMSSRTDGRDGRTDGRTRQTDRSLDVSPDSPRTSESEPPEIPQPVDGTILARDVEQLAVDRGWEPWMSDKTRRALVELAPFTQKEWKLAAEKTDRDADPAGLPYCLSLIRTARKRSHTRQENPDASYGYHPGSTEFTEGEQKL